jgi:hypothetical protein
VLENIFSTPSHFRLKKEKHKMPKSAIETYTISAHPLYSPSSNTSHLEIPTNGSDIRIIITEPTPPAPDSPIRPHYIESNSTLTRTKTPNTMPSIQIVEIPPSDKHNISRGLQTDVNNTSVANWIVTQRSSSTIDRY